MDHFRLDRLRLSFAAAALLALSACGGGGDDSTPAAAAPPPAPTTTDVSSTVIDGAIKDALVCIDKNANGVCDSGEIQGRTDASGHVTLAVPNADVGLYPIVAVVGTDAVDADHGPVTVAYTLSAPADQVAVISPLTTLVQQAVATTGATTAEAAKSIQDATGVNVSLFQNFTTAPAPTDGGVNAALLARLLVVTTQQQAATIASTLGTAAVDGSTITRADLDKAIQKKLLELLADLATILSDPAVLAATTPADQQAALAAAATALVASSGLTPASVPTVVAINNQTAAPAPVTTATPSNSAQLRTLSFASATNYFVRMFSGSIANNTPDANGNIRFVDRRLRNTGTSLAKWSAGSDPWRNADLHWNGTGWVNCPINFENVSSVRDAQGNSVYDYCDGLETGKSNRAAFDVSGKTMAEVYAQVLAAGFSNLSIANPTTALGSTVFPTGSSLFYQTGTPLTNAIAYYPAGAENPAGFSNVVTQYSAAVAAGGDASTTAGAACNSTEASNGIVTSSTTLEGLVAAKPGTPCIFGPSTYTYEGVTYQSGTNIWWGNTTTSLGKLGTAPINAGAAPGYYTTNTLLRIAFTGTGTHPVTYYACQERFRDGSPRNCTAIGTGTYAIATLGDGRAMTLTNPPAQAAALNYNRVFVERGGHVYYGYQSKPLVNLSARLNTVATGALLAQLGIPAEDPATPLALTAGSYQGTWDVRDASTAAAASNGTTVFIGADGSVSCYDRETATPESCSLTFTNLATGAFTYANGNATASGTLDFMTGTGSGTFHDPNSAPVDGSFLAGRR